MSASSEGDSDANQYVLDKNAAAKKALVRHSSSTLESISSAADSMLNLAKDMLSEKMIAPAKKRLSSMVTST